jgi:hypothetical protein
MFVQLIDLGDPMSRRAGSRIYRLALEKSDLTENKTFLGTIGPAEKS